MKKLMIILMGCFALTACETNDDNVMAEAQACLDRATDRTTAATCRSMVDGQESAAAYTIRCSADFIMQGFTASRFAQIAKQLSDKTATGNPVMRMLGYISFNSSSEADRAYTDCANTGLEGMERFAMAAKTATTLASLGGVLGSVGTDGLTPAQIQQVIDDLTTGGLASSANDETIGELVIQLNSVYCDSSSLNSSQETVCDEVDAAIAAGGGNAATIGNTFLDRLKN